MGCICCRYVDLPGCFYLVLFVVNLHVNNTCSKCLQEMLQYEPGKRISAKKAMEHPYFDDLNKAGL